ncbi:hypothetical protein [Altererythrobacter sp. Z27]|uniref:hypothetical protein n=1 Tax=Altererythrobacter sp. Z27 TaxID=3461147 RepID=UPI0040439821
MPELSESTIRVDLLGKRGDSMLMEYSTTVTDVVYRGRRLIHLSRDGQRLSIEELGEVEIGSIDPEWKPDPLARLHEPGEAPVRREVLVRCETKGQ